MVQGGRLLNAGIDIWVHINCIAWSGETVELDVVIPLDDIHACTVISKVSQACSRGRKMRCTVCSERGATVGCYHGKCTANVHFGCAVRTGWRFFENGMVYCEAHGTGYEGAPRIHDFLVARSVLLERDEDSLAAKALADDGVRIRCGSLTVCTLGEVIHDRPRFHDKKLIYPEGFLTRRHFWCVHYLRRFSCAICKGILLGSGGAILQASTVVSHHQRPLPNPCLVCMVPCLWTM